MTGVWRGGEAEWREGHEDGRWVVSFFLEQETSLIGFEGCKEVREGLLKA